MKHQNIKSETDLRDWLKEHCPSLINLQWVEPGLYGSTIGAGDVIMKRDGVKIDLELKHLDHTRKGTRFDIRPAQRRFHRMSMKRGAKTALLATERVNDFLRIFLIRGDHIPLRPYASDPDSGCPNGNDRRQTLSSGTPDFVIMGRLEWLLFCDEDYWK
jgi:hypothetical protein